MMMTTNVIATPVHIFKFQVLGFKRDSEDDEALYGCTVVDASFSRGYDEEDMAYDGRA